ncbi:MAG: TonB-dependent receptor plug domain-containing protein [Bacteroidales bacterium]
MQPESKRFTLFKTALFGVGFLCAPVSLAQKSDSIRVYELQNIEITEKARPNLTRAVVPTQILSSAQLQKLPGTHLNDALRHFSGISVKNFGGIGGLKTVSIRSLGSQHTAVCYDGITLSDCQSGQVDISRFSLDNVAQLSLNIGQTDDIFQSAKMQASAGSLNILTEQIDLNSIKKYRVRAGIATGSFGLLNSSIFYNYRFSSNFAVSAHADYLRADGKYPFEVRVKGKNQTIKGDRINSDIETFRSELNATYTPTLKQKINLKIYYFNSERGLPGPVIIDNSYSRERYFDENYFAQLGYENHISPFFRIKGAVKWNYAWNRDFKPESDKTTDDKFTQKETYATFCTLYQPYRNLSLSLSEDFSYNDLENTLFNCPFPERYTSISSLAAKYQNKRLTVVGSVLYTYITERVLTGDRPDDRKKISPALSLSFRPFYQSSFRVRASYKDIFRNPTFNDMYYLVIGNAGLKPESVKQGNLGITWNGSMCGLDYVFVSIDGYYNRVKDKIVAEPTMSIWKMVNADKTETFGSDINISAEKRLGKNFNLTIGGVYNYMNAMDISDPEAKNWRNQLQYTPKHSGNGFIQFESFGITLSYNASFASVRYKAPQNIRENQIDRYTDHSMSCFKSFEWKKHTFKLKADITNIGNKNYEIIRYYPMAPRSFRISLHYVY